MKILLLIALTLTFAPLASMKKQEPSLKRVKPSYNLRLIHKRSLSNAIMLKRKFTLAEIEKVIRKEVSEIKLKKYIKKFKPETFTKTEMKEMLKTSIAEEDETLFEMITLYIEKNY